MSSVLAGSAPKTPEDKKRAKYSILTAGIDVTAKCPHSVTTVEERPFSGMACDLPRHFHEFPYSNVRRFGQMSRKNPGRQETCKIFHPHTWN